MERYDGKTKKDDYIKYALIGGGILLLIVLYKVVTWGIYRFCHPTPDMTVVIACEHTVDIQDEKSLEKALAACIPDLDGNGKTVVEVVALRMVENEAITVSGVNLAGAQSDPDRLAEYISQGTYDLFLLANEAETRPAIHSQIGIPPAVASYCNSDYCRRLPEALASGNNPYCASLTGCKIFSDLGWERVPFYGCVQKNASQEMYELSLEILEQLKAA